jgi:hypothetical protein
MPSRSVPLVETALLYTAQSVRTLSDKDREDLRPLLTQYVDGAIDYPAVAGVYENRFQTTAPVERLRDILAVTDEPLPPHREFDDLGMRKPTQQWTTAEDNRLLAGIHRFGLENWGHIAQFVGNNRTRSQCSQRWQRGLDPRISKSRWAKQEEDQLLKLVAELGEKSWIRVANALGNRSDVQCRYRYHQIHKEAAAEPRKDPAVQIRKEREASPDDFFRFGAVGNVETLARDPAADLAWSFISPGYIE